MSEIFPFFYPKFLSLQNLEFFYILCLGYLQFYNDSNSYLFQSLVNILGTVGVLHVVKCSQF